MWGDDDDDDVGYRKPPRWTRFEKGRSGNPKGRPRKHHAEKIVAPLETEADRQLRRALNRTVRITDANGSRYVTAGEAVVLAQVNKAAQGDSNAQRDVRKAQRELEKEEALRAVQLKKKEAEQMELTFQFLVDLKSRQERAWEAAKCDGLTEPAEPWPHPEDIEINWSKREFHIRGPVSSEHVPRFRYYQAEREAHFARAIVCMRSRDPTLRRKSRFYASLMASYDVLLPKRWQISEHFESAAAIWLQMPLALVKADAHNWEIRAKLLQIYVPQDWGPDGYRFANSVMKPLLKTYGYRSLKEFERAFEETGGHPPWPKRKVA